MGEGERAGAGWMVEEGRTSGGAPVRVSARCGARRPGWVLPLAVFGLAMFLSSMWTARADASGVPTAVVYFTRIVSLVTYMLMAWTFRNHLPQVRLLVALASVLMALHLALVMLSPALVSDGGALLAVDCASGMFEGVANAVMTLLFAHVFSTYPPRRSAVGIGAAFVGVDVCILVIDLLSARAMHYARPAFTLAAMVALAVCCVRKTSEGFVPSVDDRAMQYGMARADGEERHPFTFFSRQTDWVLLLIVAVLFPSLFGVIAQVSSETGGNFALYDVSTEIVMVAVEAFFLVFLAARGMRFGFGTVLAFVIPLFATGFALFPSGWQAGNPFAGCFIRGGYALLTVMLWVLMARKSFDDPRHTYLYFGVYCGVSNAQAGRLVGSYLMRDTGPNLALCQGISLAALWVICIFGLVMFALLQRTETSGAFGQLATPNGKEELGDGSGGSARAAVSPSFAADAGAVPLESAPQVDRFSVQLEALSSRVRLTPREHEIVVQALHGYSRTSIAKKLSLSPETVKTYLNRAYEKAGVTSKQELISVVEREGV
ncbi:MAG: helix-turn-helix transcriptional regulator [Coriobacteriales bacterium]|jgi:DNA-binding CsgD family transcriptional regulator